MPFRHAFRRYSAAHDVHMVSVPLNDQLDEWHEQEMDFTSYGPGSANDCAQMNLAAIDGATAAGFSYLRPSSSAVNPLAEVASSSPSNPNDEGSFMYSHLLNVDSEPLMGNGSRTSSISTASA